MTLKNLQISKKLQRLAVALSLLFFINANKGYSQCIAVTNSPTGTITVSPYVQTCLSSNMFPGSYTTFSVSSAGQYAILTSFGTYVTVTDNANNPLAFGFGTALYTNILTPGVYRVHIHNNASCSISGGSRIVCVAPRNNAFSFDGVNDYIDLGTAITSSLTGKDKLTVEAWVYPNSNTGVHSIVGNHQGPTQFELRTNGANFNFFIGFGAFGVTSVATVTLNTWTHVAGVFNQNVLSIYINGVASGTTAVTSFSFPASSISTKIGLDGFSSRFDGAIDEVRIWNRALCLGEILNNKNGPIPTTNTGLIANYHFNQGVAGGSNPTVTSLIDNSGNGINGTVFNAALNGATSNWIGSGSYPDNGSIIPFVSPAIAITGANSVCSGNSTTLTASGNVATYTWVAGPTTAVNVVTPTTTTTYSVVGTNSLGCISNMATQAVAYNITPTVSVNSGSICSGTNFTMVPTGASTYTFSSGSAVVSPTTNSTYTVTGSSAAGCTNTAASNVTVNICAAGQALQFDGSNDYVNIGNAINSVLDPINKFTAEAWVLPSSTVSPTFDAIVGNYNTSAGGMQFLLRQSGARYEFFIDAGSGFVGVQSPVGTVTISTWQHVAGTWDGSVLRLYINGVQAGTLTAVGASFNTHANPVWIGGQALNSEYYQGQIDEVRLWTRALCQGEIQNNMNGEIPTTATGLIANYHFNQGFASQPNPSVTTLIDASGSAYTGTLTNMALTGSTSNWVAPGAVSGNVTPFVSPTVAVSGPSAICAGNSATLTANGNVTTYNWVSGPTTSVNVVTPTVTSSYSVSGTNLGCPSNVATFTVTVNSTPSVSVNSGNVCTGSSFTMAPTGASTYTFSSGSAVVTPSATSAYTVTGSSAAGCTATAVSNVTVNPLPTVNATTSSTLICTLPTQQTATLSATGATTYTWSNSTTGSSTAVSPSVTTTYTVTGTDANGCENTAVVTQSVSTCTGVENLNLNNKVAVYPNPNNGLFTIELSQFNLNTTIEVINVLGEVIYTNTVTSEKTIINLNNNTNGVYFVRINDGSSTKINKIVKQ